MHFLVLFLLMNLFFNKITNQCGIIITLIFSDLFEKSCSLFLILHYMTCQSRGKKVLRHECLGLLLRYQDIFTARLKMLPFSWRTCCLEKSFFFLFQSQSCRRPYLSSYILWSWEMEDVMELLMSGDLKPFGGTTHYELEMTHTNIVCFPFHWLQRRQREDRFPPEKSLDFLMCFMRHTN